MYCTLCFSLEYQTNLHIIVHLMTKTSQLLSVALSWELTSSSGPVLAHHTGAIIHGSLYIHGGISVNGSTSPSSKLYRFDPNNALWEEITTPGSPTLSHHASVVLDDRYLVVIGGWDGKARTSDVYVYDVVKARWKAMKTSGFPVGAGLSSFTANLLAKNKVLIIGREGSLRIQRRSGNAFMMTIDLDKGSCNYSDHAMGVASRSGHSASIIGNRMIVVGGRNDNLIEQHLGYSQPSDHQTASVLGCVSSRIEESKIKSMTKLPCGRKHHVALDGPGVVLVHGGETFDGRSRFPVGEVYLLKLKPALSVYKLRTTAVGRSGHIGVTDGENVFIHGGVGERNVVYGDMYRLKVS